VQAAQWANDLVKVTNDYLRAKAIEKSERHIEYLKQQAAATDIAQLRSAIYSVLESEIKNAMLARGNDEYALKVIDPATVPERRSSPKRAVWVSVGFVSGLFLAIAFVFFRRSWSVT
jgi:LPS O-antigen subunit length determinant protein (WzzB/FepE family)